MVTQYPGPCFCPARRGTGGYVKSLEEHENEISRSETSFPNVGLNPVGPDELERVQDPSAREAGGVLG